MKTKCQCNHESVLAPGMASLYDPVRELPFVAHAPGKCKCTNELAEFMRDGKKLTLCSCCSLSSDKRIEVEAIDAN